MADLTESVTCLPQKNEPCSCLNSSSSLNNYRRRDNTEIDDSVCSKLSESFEGNTKLYNGDLHTETDFSKFIAKDLSVLNCSEDHIELGHNRDNYYSNESNVNDETGIVNVSQICHGTDHAHTRNHIKLKCLEKLNGLTHTHTVTKHSSGDNSLLVNILNMCKEEVADTEIHHYNHNGDSCQESGGACHCVSCDENVCSPDLFCNNHNNKFDDVNTLLTDFEKTSIQQLDNSSEQCQVSKDMFINGVTYVVYESEKQMPDIMRLITRDLSEPYSIYTYRYFIHNWPHLCFLAICNTKCVGAIVCKLDLHKKMVRRGYIAMLAIDSEYRRRKIGSTLVTKAIKAMIRDDCDEVVLETEITNQSALHLYENLGFVRDKRLFRYYLNGVDALRLKLWLR